jgi:hypothetical protein
VPMFPREVAESWAINELHTTILMSLGPTPTREPGSRDKDSATCTFLVHRAYELADVAHANHSVVLLGLDDR